MPNVHMKVIDDCKHKKLGFQCIGHKGHGCEYRVCRGFEPYCCHCAKIVPKAKFELQHKPYAEHYKALGEKGTK